MTLEADKISQIDLSLSQRQKTSKEKGLRMGWARQKKKKSRLVHYMEGDLSFRLAFSVSMEMSEQQGWLKSSQTKHLNSTRPPSHSHMIFGGIGWGRCATSHPEGYCGSGVT